MRRGASRVCVARDRDRHRGVSLIVLERGLDGFERGRNLEKMGQHAQDTAELFFTDVEVPAANLLGEEGQGFRYLTSNLAHIRDERNRSRRLNIGVAHEARDGDEFREAAAIVANARAMQHRPVAAYGRIDLAVDRRVVLERELDAGRHEVEDEVVAAGRGLEHEVTPLVRVRRQREADQPGTQQRRERVAHPIRWRHLFLQPSERRPNRLPFGVCHCYLLRAENGH